MGENEVYYADDCKKNPLSDVSDQNFLSLEILIWVAC